MAKFKAKIKLQGFELEIEGERADIPLISSSLSRQLGSMLLPPDDLTASKPAPKSVELDSGSVATKARKRQGTRRSKPTDGAANELPLDTNPDRIGVPSQSWTTSQKAMWILYTLKKFSDIGEVTGAQIVATWNKAFKTFGAIRIQNVNRDLAKAQREKLIGRSTSDPDQPWYLTESGNGHVVDMMSPKSPSIEEV